MLKNYPAVSQCRDSVRDTDAFIVRFQACQLVLLGDPIWIQFSCKYTFPCVFRSEVFHKGKKLNGLRFEMINLQQYGFWIHKVLKGQRSTHVLRVRRIFIY